jgi:hypothetical protein
MANTVEQRAEGREQRAEDGEQPERRAWARVSTVEHVGMANGRLRPGRTAQIIDVSPGGALVETDWRLLPGTRVELQLGDPVTLHRVKGRIVRCHVALLDRERVRYRGALAFEEQLLLSGDGNERPAGSSCAAASDLPAPTQAG